MPSPPHHPCLSSWELMDGKVTWQTEPAQTCYQIPGRKPCWMRPQEKEVFPGGSDGKESTCNAGDLGSISGSGRSPGGGKGYPLQYSGLENPMDYSPWGCKELDMTEGLTTT